MSTRTAAEVAASLVADKIPFAWGGGDRSGPSPGIPTGDPSQPVDTAHGFDAGSLAQHVLHESAGIRVPRTVERQFDEFTDDIPLESIEPGDLVFPLRSFSDSGPTYNGVYIGGGRVVEASSPGHLIKIAPLDPQSVARRPFDTART